LADERQNTTARVDVVHAADNALGCAVKGGFYRGSRDRVKKQSTL
jgi:hypothetical protein